MPILTKLHTNAIADDAVTAAKTASSAELELSSPASADLSGTVSVQQLRLADAFTVTSDLTVNDELVLGKLTDDGTGQTLTGSGKTITGTGTITMGSVVTSKRSIDGLSGGTLSSKVEAPSLILTPSSVPTSPAPVEGQIYYNNADDAIYMYNGSAWHQMNNSPFSATGGTVTTYTGYKVHTFTTSGTFTVSGTSGLVDYLVVAGGGGGGAGYHAGGGGAGGFRTATGFPATNSVYTITVGAYGAGQAAINSSSALKGSNGFPSAFGSITATGGGGGATYWNGSGSADGEDGGSGGGAGTASTPLDTGGTGINDGGTFGTATYQGHAGGDSTAYADPYSGGGGGGAGAVGANAGGSGVLGHGGVGEDQVMGMNAADSYTLLTNASAGHVVSGARYFAGGGGGGSQGSSGAINGGSGGGGAGGIASGTPVSGLSNTGGGGGGGGLMNIAGANGGSGIVIIRYTI